MTRIDWKELVREARWAAPRVSRWHLMGPEQELCLCLSMEPAPRGSSPHSLRSVSLPGTRQLASVLTFWDKLISNRGLPGL